MTALQELIKLWEQQKEEVPKKHYGIKNIYDLFLKDANNLLAKEKQQIVDAFNKGSIPEPYNDFYDGKHYYEQTYNK